MINDLWFTSGTVMHLPTTSGSSGSNRTSTVRLNRAADYYYPTLELNWSGRRALLPRPPRPERGDLLADLRPDKVFNYSFTT